MEEVHPLKSFRDSQQPPLTQERLGELLGVSKVSISRWETGERKPEPELLAGISEKTGIPPERLRPDLAELFSLRRTGRDPAKSRVGTGRVKSRTV